MFVFDLESATPSQHKPRS